MENLDDILIDHDIPEHFPGQPEGLEVAQLIHVPDVDEEGVPAVVQLHHLDETAPPKTALQVDPQDRTVEDVRRATVQGLVVEDIVGLALYEGLAFLERRKWQLFLGVWGLVRTGALFPREGSGY